MVPNAIWLNDVYQGAKHTGRSREGGKTHPAAGRITAYAQNKRGAATPLYADCSSPGIFCRQEVLFGISRNGIGRRPAGNEDFNNRVAAQTVAAMDAARSPRPQRTGRG